MNRARAPHLWLFLLPALAVYGTFVVYPFLNTFYLSFHQWDGFGDIRWAGISNFYASAAGEGTRSLVADEVFRRALRNNVVYWIITLISEVVVGLGLAALLTRCDRGKTFYQLALSTPLMIALVASAVLWRLVLADKGILNVALESIGLGGMRRNWVDADHVVYTVSAISGWAYAGFYMLIFRAGLERIPAELREAATIDGATEWGIFRLIELPLLRPVIAVAVLMCSTGAFRAFDLFYVIVGTARASTSEVASSWLVKNAFTFKFYGYASAIAVAVVVIVMALASALSWWISRQRELEEF